MKRIANRRSGNAGGQKRNGAMKLKVAGLLASTAAAALMLGGTAQAQTPTYDAATGTITFSANASPYTRTELRSANINAPIGPGNMPFVIVGPPADSAGFKVRQRFIAPLTINVNAGAIIQNTNSSNETDAIQIFENPQGLITLNNDGIIRTSANAGGNQAAFTWRMTTSGPVAPELAVNNTGRIYGFDDGFVIFGPATNGITNFVNSQSGEIIGDNIGGNGGRGIVSQGLKTDGIDNDGLIRGAVTGVELDLGDDVVLNRVNGRIIGLAGRGADLGGGNDTVTNLGLISGFSIGASLGDGNDRLENTATGVVSGNFGTGADLGEGDDVVLNEGNIGGQNGGVLLGGGNDTLDNFAGAQITGSRQAVAGGAGNDIIRNAGSISGDVFAGSGDDFVNLIAGSSTSGDVRGEGDNDQLFVRGDLFGSLLAGDGEDEILVEGDGSISGIVNAGDGNDSVVMTGNIAIAGNIFLGAGDDTQVIDNTSVYNGGVFGQDGSDTITITSNFDMNHLSEIDGGGGTAVIGGDFDELRLQGQNFDAATSTYLPTTFQSIVLQQASELRLHDTQTLTTGRLTTEAGTLFGFDGTANISDGASLGALLNNGFTTSSNGRTGDILNIGGDFTGSGSLFLDAALDATEASDFVVVGGTTTSGDTQSIVINDVGNGIGAETGMGPGNGIKLVDVSATGATQVGDFILAGGPIDVGAFQYDLSLQTDDIWYLQSFAVVDPGVITPGLPLHIKSFGQQTVGTYYERTGTRIGCRTAGIGHQFNRSNADLITTEPVPEPVLEDESCNYGVWARAIGAWSDAQGNITNSGNTIGAYDETLWAIQGGVDGVLAEYETGYLTASGFLQYGQVKADYRNVSLGTDVGSTDADAYGGGGSLTYNDQNGLYLDGVVTYTHYDIDIATTAGDTANTKADAWVFSGELGKRVDVGEQFAITPQGQLTYQLINVDGYTTALGTQANVSNANSLEGRLGATFEYLPHRADSASRLYVEANVVHEFLDAPVTTIGNTALAYDFEDTAYEIGVGYQWGEKGAEGLAMWIEGDYRAPFSDDGIDIWAATAGLAYRF